MNCPNCNIWFPSSESKCHRCGTTLEKDSSSDILVHYCKFKHEEDIPETKHFKREMLWRDVCPKHLSVI